MKWNLRTPSSILVVRMSLLVSEYPAPSYGGLTPRENKRALHLDGFGPSGRAHSPMRKKMLVLGGGFVALYLSFSRVFSGGASGTLNDFSHQSAGGEDPPSDGENASFSPDTIDDVTLAPATEEEMSECLLWDSTFASLLQLFLAFVGLSSLLYKRHRERPQRPLVPFVFDATKQGAAAIFAHVWNMVLSYVFKIYAQRPRLADECAYYAICYSLDVTVGLLLIYLLLKVQKHLSQKHDWASLRNSGCYGDPPDTDVFVRQLGAYMLIVMIAKVLCAMFLLCLQGALEAISGLLLWPFRGFPNLELLVVMLVCPCFLNVVYVWNQDNLIKGNLGIGGFDVVICDDDEASFGLGFGAGELSFKAASHENFDAEFIYSPTLKKKYASIDEDDGEGEGGCSIAGGDVVVGVGDSDDHGGAQTGNVAGAASSIESNPPPSPPIYDDTTEETL